MSAVHRFSFGPTARATLTLTTCALALGLAPISSAQTSTPPAAPAQAADSGLEEITVTALRVRQPLQKTAASVFVLTADDLQTAGVQNLTDVAKLVPNLTFNSYYRAGVPYISLRGIPTAQGGEAPVAFIVDGVQAPGLDFINQDLLDLSDIQVLRGPQGALYGRGAIAGAILINTQKPTDDYHDTLTLDYGNGDFFRAVNTASGPVVTGKLWAKLTLEDRNFSGLIEDEGLNRAGDWAREKAARGEILAQPTDTTTVDLTWSHTQGVDGASFIDMAPNIYDFQNARPDRNLDTYDRRIIDSFAAKIDQETPIGTVTSISQFAQSLSRVLGDADWTPAPVAVQENNIQVRAFNEDIRLTSPTGMSYQWLVGSFFQYRDTVNFLDVFGEPGGPLAGFPTPLAFSDDDAKSLAYALYAQGSVDLPYDLKLSAALRFDVDNRYDNDRSVSGTSIRTAFYALQPTGTLSKQFTPDLLGYVTIGKGFRSGGFNGYADTLVFPGVVKREYPKETNVNYEAGVKSQFFDNRLTVNASVYHTDYNNEQYFLINISPPARDIVSLKSVSINGGELEVNYRPVAGLTLTGALGVADSNINSNDGIGDQNKHSPDANTYNSDFAIEYTKPLWNDYDALFRVDYAYLGPIYYDPANDYAFHPVGYLNARIALEMTNYTVAIWGKNLSDTRAPTVFTPNSFGPGIGGRIDNEPATFGVEITSRF